MDILDPVKFREGVKAVTGRGHNLPPDLLQGNYPVDVPATISSLADCVTGRC